MSQGGNCPNTLCPNTPIFYTTNLLEFMMEINIQYYLVLENMMAFTTELGIL